MSIPDDWKDHITALSYDGAVCLLNNAAAEGRNDVIATLFTRMYDGTILNPNEYPAISLPAIIHAACRGHAGTIKLLANLGADVNITTPNRHTALKSAAKNRRYNAIAMLLNLGADPNAETADGRVALHLLCDQFHSDSLPTILHLLSVTAAQYHQTAYDWCSDAHARIAIRSNGVIARTSEPEGGFGGPEDKEDVRMRTPPTDPLLAELWMAMNMIMDTKDDPNRLYGIITTYYNLPGSTQILNSPDEIQLDYHTLCEIVDLFKRIAGISGRRLPAEIPGALQQFSRLYPVIVERYTT